MNEKNGEKGNDKEIKKEKENWFKKLDGPLKSLNYRYTKLLNEKKKISKNQIILNEYNIKNPQVQNNKIKKEEKIIDEKLLLKRVRVSYILINGIIYIIIKV